MSRNKFRLNTPYAARLLRVTRRPLENGDEAGIYLLRLEFEMFQFGPNAKVLHAMNCVASRDIVVGTGLRERRTARVSEYAEVLGIRNIDDVVEWSQLGKVGPRAWVTVKFGPADEADYRNPFRSVESLDAGNYDIRGVGGARLTDWTTVSFAARELHTSSSTIRRRLPALEKIAPAKLVKLTNGGHRRINLPLLRNMWTETLR